MLSLVFAFLRSLTAASHSRRRLVMENLALRHQLLVLNRTAKAPALRNSDQLFWAALCAMWSRWTKALASWAGQQIVNAFPFETPPKCLLRDRDCIYGAEFARRVAALGIEEKLTAPRLMIAGVRFTTRLLGGACAGVSLRGSA